MNLSPRKKLFVDTATEMFGVGAVITKQQVSKLLKKLVFLILLGLGNLVK